MRALQRALVSVIITLLNDSERSLNKKWLRPVTNKSNPPHWLEIKAKNLPTFSLNFQNQYLTSQLMEYQRHMKWYLEKSA